METADIVAIEQVYALYGHVMDRRLWDRLGDVFTEDCEFDASALGIPLMRGLAGVRKITEETIASGREPLGHHATNVFVDRIEGDQATVWAKAIGIYSRARAFSGEYQDRLRRTPAGWRISRRLNLPREAFEPAVK